MSMTPFKYREMAQECGAFYQTHSSVHKQLMIGNGS